MPPFKPPAYQSTAFNCPSCTAYAKHTWLNVFRQQPSGQVAQVPNHFLALCDHCGRMSIWVDGAMTFPSVSTAPLPNPDLPQDVLEDFEEARQVLVASPRGSAALLRLAVQRFCKHLGEKGDNINNDIAELVKKGLPVTVQRALDAVRVIGNNAVHPGQIDISDDPETASRLFELVNIVCDYMVSQPKRVAEIYEKIPPRLKDAINQRDGT